jgi:UDPglucose 6-dehydrogenase
VAAIAHQAKEAGAPSGLLEAVLRNNERQPLEAVRMLEAELGGLRGRKVALLGLAFKADTDDVRETRALPLWRALTEAGADVACHDPRAGPAFLKLAPGARLAPTVEAALEGADGVVLQTEWPEYRALDPRRLKALLRTPVVVDGRRTFSPAAMAEAGLRYRAIGLGSVPGDATTRSG